ncbi:CoA transferase, partial [Chloroflexota bacterium]
MASPLDGIRVVDWSTWIVGPEAAALLGDMGAEVIHVEQPGTGDQSRGIRTSLGVSQTLPTGSNAVYVDHNRNKKGIAVDLTKPEGQEIIYRLVKESDVLITNFRRPAGAKLGMDYETLSRINPRLVYAISSAYGEKGPDADTPGFAFNVAAHSGMTMTCSGGVEDPCRISTGLGDEAGAFLQAMGILGAL